MDDASTPRTDSTRTPRWRSPWVLPGVPVAVLAAATVNVLSNGPLFRMDTWGRGTAGAWC